MGKDEFDPSEFDDGDRREIRFKLDDHGRRLDTLEGKVADVEKVTGPLVVILKNQWVQRLIILGILGWVLGDRGIALLEAFLK